MKNVLACIVVAALILGAYWIGLGVGHKEAASSVSEYDPYEYVDCTTCWVELYDDGRAIIHTEQQWLTNDDEGNIVILTETMELIE